MNVGLLHGIEILGILGDFHGGLGEEDHVVGKLGEAAHEFEALGASGFEFGDAGWVVLRFGECDVGKRDRIEVVVGECDEAVAELAELNEFLNDGVGGALPRNLAVGAPDGAERAVFGAAAKSLDRGPHVGVGREKIPAGGLKVFTGDPAAVIKRLRVPGFAIGEDHLPYLVSVAFDNGVGGAKLLRFFGIERGVDSAIHDPGATFAGETANFHAAQSVGGVDADADDVAVLNTGGINLREGFVDDDR